MGNAVLLLCWLPIFKDETEGKRGTAAKLVVGVLAATVLSSEVAILYVNNTFVAGCKRVCDTVIMNSKLYVIII